MNYFNFIEKKRKMKMKAFSVKKKTNFLIVFKDNTILLRKNHKIFYLFTNKFNVSSFLKLNDDYNTIQPSKIRLNFVQKPRPTVSTKLCCFDLRLDPEPCSFYARSATAEYNSNQLCQIQTNFQQVCYSKNKLQSPVLFSSEASMDYYCPGSIFLNERSNFMHVMQRSVPLRRPLQRSYGRHRLRSKIVRVFKNPQRRAKQSVRNNERIVQWQDNSDSYVNKQKEFFFNGLFFSQVLKLHYYLNNKLFIFSTAFGASMHIVQLQRCPPKDFVLKRSDQGLCLNSFSFFEKNLYKEASENIPIVRKLIKPENLNIRTFYRSQVKSLRTGFFKQKQNLQPFIVSFSELCKKLLHYLEKKKKSKNVELVSENGFLKKKYFFLFYYYFFSYKSIYYNIVQNRRNYLNLFIEILTTIESSDKKKTNIYKVKPSFRKSSWNFIYTPLKKSSFFNSILISFYSFSKICKLNKLTKKRILNFFFLENTFFSLKTKKMMTTVGCLNLTGTVKDLGSLVSSLGLCPTKSYRLHWRSDKETSDDSKAKLLGSLAQAPCTTCKSNEKQQDYIRSPTKSYRLHWRSDKQTSDNSTIVRSKIAFCSGLRSAKSFAIKDSHRKTVTNSFAIRRSPKNKSPKQLRFKKKSLGGLPTIVWHFKKGHKKKIQQVRKQFLLSVFQEEFQQDSVEIRTIGIVFSLSEVSFCLNFVKNEKQKLIKFNGKNIHNLFLKKRIKKLGNDTINKLIVFLNNIIKKTIIQSIRTSDKIHIIDPSKNNFYFRNRKIDFTIFRFLKLDLIQKKKIQKVNQLKYFFKKLLLRAVNGLSIEKQLHYSCLGSFYLNASEDNRNSSAPKDYVLKEVLWTLSWRKSDINYRRPWSNWTTKSYLTSDDRTKCYCLHWRSDKETLDKSTYSRPWSDWTTKSYWTSDNSTYFCQGFLRSPIVFTGVQIKRHRTIVRALGLITALCPTALPSPEPFARSSEAVPLRSPLQRSCGGHRTIVGRKRLLCCTVWEARAFCLTIVLCPPQLRCKGLRSPSYVHCYARSSNGIRLNFIIDYNALVIRALKKITNKIEKEKQQQKIYDSNANKDLYQILWKFAKRRHNSRSNRWVYYRYWKKNLFFFENNVSKYYLLDYNYQRKKYGF